MCAIVSRQSLLRCTALRVWLWPRVEPCGLLAWGLHLVALIAARAVELRRTITFLRMALTSIVVVN